MGCPLGAHVILMVMGSQNRIHMLEGKGIKHEGNIAQVGLHRPAAAHVGHLVTHLHLAVAVGALTVAAPEINGNVGAAGGLEPDAGAAQPPHFHIALRNDGVFNILYKPGAPFGEGGLYPGISGHFTYFAHDNSSCISAFLGCCPLPLRAWRTACQRRFPYLRSDLRSFPAPLQGG